MSTSTLLATPPRLAAALVLAVIGSATTAAAQLPVSVTSAPVTRTQSHDRQQPFSDTSPCTGETFVGTGQFHEQFTDSSTPTMTRTSFRTHQNGKGTSATAAYQYQHWAQNDFESSATTFTSRIVNRKHMIRTGSNAPVKDDFFMRETIVLSFNGPIMTASIEEFKPEDTCK